MVRLLHHSHSQLPLAAAVNSVIAAGATLGQGGQGSSFPAPPTPGAGFAGGGGYFSLYVAGGGGGAGLGVTDVNGEPGTAVALGGRGGSGGKPGAIGTGGAYGGGAGGALGRVAANYRGGNGACLLTWAQRPRLPGQVVALG